MLARAVLDAPLGFNRPLVMGIHVEAHARVGRALLLLRIVAVAVLAIAARAIERQFILREALIAHLRLVHRAGETGEDGEPIIVPVIHRHMPLGDGHVLGQRNDEGIREDDVGHPHMGKRVVDLAQGGDAHAVVGAVDIDLRARIVAQHLGDRQVRIRRRATEGAAIGAVGVCILLIAMEEGGMRRVHADFQRLQPVALDETLEGEGVRVRRDEAVEVREGRRRAFAQISEDDARTHLDRIGTLPDIVAEPAALGLCRRVEALAVHVEEPAVERTAQSAIFQPAKGEVGIAVGTIPIDQADAASLVAEQHEIAAHQPNRLERATRHLAEFVDKRCRLPVAVQQATHRRIGFDARDQLVLFLAHHGGGLLAAKLPAVCRPPGQRASRPISGA